MFTNKTRRSTECLLSFSCPHPICSHTRLLSLPLFVVFPSCQLNCIERGFFIGKKREGGGGSVVFEEGRVVHLPTCLMPFFFVFCFCFCFLFFVAWLSVIATSALFCQRFLPLCSSSLTRITERDGDWGTVSVPLYARVSSSLSLSLSLSLSSLPCTALRCKTERLGLEKKGVQCRRVSEEARVTEAVPKRVDFLLKLANQGLASI